ncbi:MAG: ribonuclease Z [Cyclobacteriaceae bacterium]|jgi:ribonuclease Z|nr:ribonuclease Z [Cyclobacteriaceae bacterium]
MGFQVTIVGSSGAVPAFGRHPSCQFVQVQNRCLLLDCGEAAQMQLNAYQLPLHKINHIFISHLHGDHYLGLMGLLFTMHLQKRTAELHLYSPRGLDEIIVQQLKHSNSALHFNIDYTAFRTDTPQCLLDDEAITVTTIPLRHKLPTAGFLISEKTKPLRIDKNQLMPGMKLQHIAQLKQGSDVVDEGKTLYRAADFTLPPRPSYTYAYCSDTAFAEEVVAQVQGADLLYHEATFRETDREKAGETLHSTAQQAAEVAKRAHVKKLIIGHFSARYRELDGLLAEAKDIFPETLLATEGRTFDLDAHDS